jgi:Zn-dependent protease with chaperone function
MGQRSQALLFALAFIAAANGLLLALSLYGLLTAALHVIGDHAPGIGWGLLAGAIGAVALLVRAFTRAAQTRKLLYGRSLLDYEVPARTDLVARLTDLHGRSKLPRPPSLRLVGGELPNAYTVARSPEEAAIVLTDGLLARLGPVELEAVIAHALAQIENEDIVTVGVADAVAVSIEELSRLKGRFFWGPREILTDILPFLGAMAALAVVDALLPKDSSNTLVVLAFVVLLLGLFRVLWRAAVLSWRGLAQLTLFALFFTPLTLIEWCSRRRRPTSSRASSRVNG